MCRNGKELRTAHGVCLLLCRTFVVLAEVPGARLEITPFAFGRFGRVFLSLPEVFQVGAAKPTADSVHVEVEILLGIGVQSTQQVTSQLFSSRTTDSMPSPDGTQRVHTGIPPSDHMRKTLGERSFLTHCLF